MDNQSRTPKSNVKSIARRWATAGTGGLLVAVAGYAAITGSAVASNPANGSKPSAPIAAAVAGVAREAFASGAIVSSPDRVTLVNDSSTFSTFSVSNTSSEKVAPFTSTTVTPTTQPGALSLVTDIFAPLTPVAFTDAPTTAPTTQPMTTALAPQVEGDTAWADAGLPADWSDAVADDVVADVHDAMPATAEKAIKTDTAEETGATVTWDPGSKNSGSAFNSQNAPGNPNDEKRVGDASPENPHLPAAPDVKGTPWTPARSGSAAAQLAPVIPPVAAMAAPAKIGNGMVTSGLDSNGRVILTLNRTAELKTKSPVKRVSVGQPEIADVQPFNTNMILVTAKKAGATQVIVWDEQDRSQSIDVSVEIPLDQLKDLIGKVAPNATVDVAVANDQIVLRGQAPNLGVAKQVSDLAGAYGKVQNFIEVAGAQTVAVQVQFAEVSRSVTNDLGVSWAYQNGTSIFGSDPGLSNKLGFSTSEAGAGTGFSVATNPSPFNFFGGGSINGNPFAYFVKALRDNNLLRILQEPTLTTTSGEAASFLAGGQVPVPVPADNGQIAIEYKEFGVRLKLTPVVLGNGKIRLVMEAESSELDYANGTTISGAAVPGLRTRRVQNTVELGEGQTISVAGLLDDSVTASKRSVPLLGDIPVLGQLFRSTRYQRRETELVVLITPRLAGAMNPDQVTPLPGSGWRHPNELEQFAFGDLGGNKEADATKDWNKPTSERGLRNSTETQKNTTRTQEPAALTRNSPPPMFVGDHGFVAPEPETYSTARD